MEKKHIIFIFVVGCLLLINIACRCIEIYDFFVIGRVSALISLGISWVFFLSILAFAGLFIHKPIGYLMFMIYPLYTIMNMLVFDLSFICSHFLIFGIVFTGIFNLNFIRRLYINNTRELLSHLLLALFVALFGVLQKFLV